MIRIILYWLALSVAIVLFRLLAEGRIHVVMDMNFWGLFSVAAGLTLFYSAVAAAVVIGVISLFYYIKNKL